MAFMDKRKKTKIGNKSQVAGDLPTALIISMAEDWIEAYESGWRPNIYTPASHDEAYDYLKEAIGKVVLTDGY